MAASLSDRMGGDSRWLMVFRPRMLRNVCACVCRFFARHVRDVYRHASLSLEVGEQGEALMCGAVGLRGRRVRRQRTRREGY